MDWASIIRLAAPAIGEMATTGSHGAVMRGYLDHSDRLAEQRRQQLEDQQRRESFGAQFNLHALEALSQIDDPAQFEQFKTAYLQAAPHVGANPSDLMNVAFNHTAETRKHVAAVKSAVDAWEKSTGHSIDEPEFAGHSLRIAGQPDVTFEHAAEMIRGVAIDPTGKPVSIAKKAPIEGTTDLDRFTSAWARDRGKKLNDLTAAERAQARTAWQATSPTPTPRPAAETPTKEYARLLGEQRTAKANGDTALAATIQLKLDDIKTSVNIGDNPSTKGAGGLAPGQEFQMSERLAKNWQDATKATREMTRQFDIMQSGLKRFQQGDKNGGSQAVLVTFQKILDPTSVVRESEYARSAEGISLMRRIDGYVDRLVSGGAGVPYAELAGMVETARSFVDNMKTYASGTRHRIEAQADKYKIDRNLIFDDTQGTSPTTGGPRVGERRTGPNGQTGEWDGTGWKVVTP